MSLSREIIEQAQHMPSIEKPVAFAGSMAVASLTSAATWIRHGRTSEAFAVHSTNPPLLEQTIVAVDGSVAKANRIGRPRRLTGGLMSLVGFGMLVGSQTGQFTYETEEANSAASSVVLLDTSFSMDTQDLGQPGLSRLQAAVDGLEHATFAGNLGVVDFAQTHSVRIPLSKQWESQANSLASRPIDPKTGDFVVNPNGGNLVNALERSIELLPGQISGEDQSISRDGTIMVVTDGTEATDPEQVSELLANNDVDVSVIVTGTPEGTYVRAGSRVDSGIRPELFESISDNVTVAGTPEEISAAIEETIEESGTTRQEHDWQLVDGLGLVLLGAGIARVNHQLATKKV